jgi:hypothetical protein
MIILSMSILTAAVFAIETADISRPQYWVDSSVLVARCAKITRQDEGVMVTFEVLGKLAGTHDPAADDGAMDVFVNTTPTKLTDSFLPKPQETAIVVIRHTKGIKAELEGADIEFMPSKKAVLVVKGLDDPEVYRVRLALREWKRKLNEMDDSPAATIRKSLDELWKLSNEKDVTATNDEVFRRNLVRLRRGIDSIAHLDNKSRDELLRMLKLLRELRPGLSAKTYDVVLEVYATVKNKPPK